MLSGFGEAVKEETGQLKCCFPGMAGRMGHEVAEGIGSVAKREYPGIVKGGRRVKGAGQGGHRFSGKGGACREPAGGFAGVTTGVATSFTGDDPVGPGKVLVDFQQIKEEIGTAHQPGSAEGHQPGSHAPGGPHSGEIAQGEA